MKYFSIAPLYDFFLDPFLGKVRKVVQAVIINLEPESLIDICCGTAKQLKHFEKTGIQITGIDNSQAMIKASGRNYCQLMDATNIGISQKFDCALLQFALHEKTSDTQKKIIYETNRILNDGGYLVICDYQLTSKTHKQAKLIINTIEYLAGKTHFRNFKNYNHNGGLRDIIPANRFKLIKNISIAGKSITVSTFQKI